MAHSNAMDAAPAMAFFHTSRLRSSTPAAMTTTSFSQFNRYNSVYNLLLFHRIDRDIYDRLIAHGATPLVARNIVALLVWLDNTGINVIPYLNNNFNDDAFLRLTAEAESILDFLRRAYLPPRESVVLSIPVIASLSTIGPINCGFFNCHRHEAAERIAETLAVGRFFFDNALFATFRRYEAAVEDARQCNTAPPPMPLELARPFMPVFSTAAASVDERSLVIAFLRASPLSEEEIAAYFQKQWGNCVDRVAFEEMPASSSSAHSCARVVFKREGYVALVLHGPVEFRFAINGKQVLARRVEQRRS